MPQRMRVECERISWALFSVALPGIVSAPAAAQPAPDASIPSTAETPDASVPTMLGVPDGGSVPASPEDAGSLSTLDGGGALSPPADAGGLSPQAQQLLDEIGERLQRGDSPDAIRRDMEVGANVSAGANHPATPDLGSPPVVYGAVAGWNLFLTGFLQLDEVTRESSEDQVDPSTGQPLNENRFLVRRARIRVVMERPYMAGAIEIDGNSINGAVARVLGVEASVFIPSSEDPRMPLVMATLGSFKIPFGFEVPQSDRDRPFMERSTMSRALFPGEYDLGARIMGGWRFARYAIALQNGEPYGETGGFPARDPNAAKDLTLHVGVDTGVDDPFRISGGLSFLEGTGFHANTPGTKDTLVWRDLNGDGVLQINEIQVLPGQAPTPAMNFNRWGYGADLQLSARWPGAPSFIGQTMLYGEVDVGSNLDRGVVPADPIAAGRSLRELGYYAALTQEFLSFLLVGFRYDYYNPDQDAVDSRQGLAVPQNASFSAFSTVIEGFNPWGRLMLQYDINRNHLGRDLAGVPTNLPSNQLTLRAEVKF